PEGKYRLVKPFREAGANSDEYAALWDFNMSENVTPGNELLCTAECTDTIVSANASTITCKVSANKILFLMSENTDIERETAAGWQSVRKTSIYTNTAHASFPLASSGTYEIDASDFDISKSGNYRVRFSYCSCDEQSIDAHYNGYDTAYAYFKVN
ncbi:MAG: hypothetical protein K2N72_00290, partial [Oscillospiraceae bacterium]|nr:hypothetical protein [Oscillospiraceae bacterium]